MSTRSASSVICLSGLSESGSLLCLRRSAQRQSARPAASEHFSRSDDVVGKAAADLILRKLPVVKTQSRDKGAIHMPARAQSHTSSFPRALRRAL